VKVLCLKNVHAEDETSLAEALSLIAHGIDLADAMHQALVRRARRAGVSGISEI